jgi:hypothetical protein
LVQAAGLFGCGMVSAWAALVAACALAGMLGALGLPRAGSPALYAAFTLAATFNPACAALLPLLIPVRPPSCLVGQQGVCLARLEAHTLPGACR